MNIFHFKSLPFSAALRLCVRNSLVCYFLPLNFSILCVFLFCANLIFNMIYARNSSTGESVEKALPPFGRINY